MITTLGLRARMDAASPLEGSGKELHRTKNVMKCVWDFAVQGGAVGSLLLLDDLGNAAKLPSGAIITGGYIDIITAISSTSNDGTIALTAQSAGDLKAAVDGDTLSGIVALIPVGTAATAIKLTAERQITLTIAVHALLTGKISVYVEYLAS